MAEWSDTAAELAATDAEDELTSQEDFTDLVRWWYKYFLATGHKRLGRMIIGAAKDMGILEDVVQKKQSDYQ